eukprot:6476374-Amphidinium_carterae.2
MAPPWARSFGLAQLHGKARRGHAHFHRINGKHIIFSHARPKLDKAYPPHRSLIGWSGTHDIQLQAEDVLE